MCELFTHAPETPHARQTARSDDDKILRLDLAANITSVNGDGSEWLFGHDATNRTTTITSPGGRAAEQTYDSAGRLIQAADGTRYAYNALDQRIEVSGPDGTRTSYTYYPTGQRATQTTTTTGGESSTISYVYGADGTVISETDQDGASASYLLAHTREARTLTGDSAAARYYLTGRRGDKLASTGPHGALRTRTAYSDYGTPTRSDANGQPLPGTPGLSFDPYGYTGAPHDPNGLIHLATRYYQPTLHAFITPDTPAAGMLNAYTYATGDPINQTDPTGMAPEWLNWGNGLAAAGLGFSLGGVIGSGIALAAITPATSPLVVGLAAVSAIAALAEFGMTTALVGEQLGKWSLSSEARSGLQWGSLAAGLLSAGTGAAAAAKALRRVPAAGGGATETAPLIGGGEIVPYSGGGQPAPAPPSSGPLVPHNAGTVAVSPNSAGALATRTEGLHPLP